MFKQSLPFAYDFVAERPRTRRPGLLLLLALSLCMAPVAGEAVAVCYAEWCEILDKPIEVPTPLLDSLSGTLQNARQRVEEHFLPQFEDAIRDSKIAFPIALLLIVRAMTMLRR